ncbi:aspartate:alanine exchanger family transporter [Lentibacillus saliphilus]|uniref:aspartate:alanine exchanger family transporter n=1 Tax=Lentibacillus saliphilus TaxID=2737028 RepID=UPI001C30AF86|nr:TrkA C-terminal domain-containing protein [Lentibacillus saliphilus]
MDYIINLLNEPLILVFIILFIGSWFGSLKISGISLGTSGVLLIAMVFGHFGFQVSPIVQSLGLSLFIVAVGLQAGPRFFRMMRSNGLVFGIIALLIVTVSIGTTVIVSKLLDLSPGLSVGLMTGALTSTPGLAAALQATNDPLASVGYGIAYPFGVLALVLFVQLLPRIGKYDLQKDLDEANNPIKTEESPEFMTVEVTNPDFDKKTLEELAFNKKSIVISRVIRNQHTMIAVSDTVILLGDELVAVGVKPELDAFCEYAGKQVDTHLDNPDNIQLRKVTVDSDNIAGKSLKKLCLRHDYGTTVTRIEREGLELNQNPNMPLMRGDVLTMVSSESRLDEVEQLFSKKKLAVTNIDIFSISITLLIGILVGMIPIPIPGLGVISLGTAGGPLFVALIIGHFGKLGPIHVRYYGRSNQVVQELGLVLFLAGAGTTAGQGLLDVVQAEGLKLVLGGTIITVIPILIGYLIANKLFKLSIVHSLGALCGGMTSTPALGSLNQLIDSEDPAVAYAAAYPFALIFIAIAAQLVVYIM